mmetsp:Transcript_18120/g.59188  ORF Transcript_18120/g.59188 Transcript_18120/m.59188 type:complete len:561 (-) Transcript_18120:154-1836(-)
MSRTFAHDGPQTYTIDVITGNIDKLFSMVINNSAQAVDLDRLTTDLVFEKQEKETRIAERALSKDIIGAALGYIERDLVAAGGVLGPTSGAAMELIATLTRVGDRWIRALQSQERAFEIIASALCATDASSDSVYALAREMLAVTFLNMLTLEATFADKERRNSGAVAACHVPGFLVALVCYCRVVGEYWLQILEELLYDNRKGAAGAMAAGAVDMLAERMADTEAPMSSRCRAAATLIPMGMELPPKMRRVLAKAMPGVVSVLRDGGWGADSIEAFGTVISHFMPLDMGKKAWNSIAAMSNTLQTVPYHRYAALTEEELETKVVLQRALVDAGLLHVVCTLLRNYSGGDSYAFNEFIHRLVMVLDGYPVSPRGSDFEELEQAIRERPAGVDERCWDSEGMLSLRLMLNLPGTSLVDTQNLKAVIKRTPDFAEFSTTDKAMFLKDVLEASKEVRHEEHQEALKDKSADEQRRRNKKKRRNKSASVAANDASSSGASVAAAGGGEHAKAAACVVCGAEAVPKKCSECRQGFQLCRQECWKEFWKTTHRKECPGRSQKTDIK